MRLRACIALALLAAANAPAHAEAGPEAFAETVVDLRINGQSDCSDTGSAPRHGRHACCFARRTWPACA